MKRFPIYIALSASALLASCSKELDQPPSNALPEEEAVETLTELHRAVNGVYSPLVTRYGYGGDVALYADAKGGDVKLGNEGYQQSVASHRFRTTKNSGISEGAYRQFAFVLGRVNNVLPKAENIRQRLDQSGNAAERAQVRDEIAQLYALRGLAHFELARLYSYIPTTGVNVQAQYSGIPLNVEVYPHGHQFQRSTLQETYDQVIADLTRALSEGLSEDRVDDSGHFNSWAAKALLARVYLYYGDYQKAYDNAEDVIANGPYTLYTREEYPTVWDKVGTSESILEILTTAQLYAGLNSLGGYTNPSGYAEYAASDDFLAWLRAGRTDDVRFSRMITERSNAGSNNGYYSRKYLGQQGSSNPTAINNYKVLRLSELYLIAAEAILKGATPASGKTALSYYNTLRQNRIQSYSPATAVTLEDLLDERRIEFFCEGHRLYDLVRNRINVKSAFISNAQQEYDYLEPSLLIELPEREKNISPALVLQATK